MKAGLAVIEALRAEGVEYTFGVVGSTTNSIVTEMYGRSDIRFVDTRHEEGAAFIAYGYSRASGKPTACITTSGPGTINLVTGIALAAKGRAPVIVIAGDVAREYIYRDGSQAFDLVGLFKPITKLALEVNKTERIPEMLHYAFRAALSDKRGPVFLDIPRDLLDGQTIEGDVLSPEAYRAVDARIAGDPQAIQRAVTLLAQAQRPLLLVGGGVIDADASKEAVALAELLDMALVPSYGHSDAIPNSHHLYIGPPGGRGSGEAAEALHRADVILALGTRLNQPTTFWNYRVINPATRIVQVDIDAQEIGRNYPVAVGITGDARAVAEQFCRALRDAYPQGRANPAWRSEVAALAARRRQRLEAELTLAGEPMMPQRVYPELRKVLPRDCMVTIDAGVAPGLAYDRLHFEIPRTLFNYAGHGGLGMGYCVGLGTKLGRPDRPAVSLQGDGGFLYTSQEINTAVRWGIPLVSIVLNNNCHGAEKAQQQRHYGGRYIGVDLVNPRFDKLAEVYGARGMYVQRPDEIADAVRTALGANGPVVIEIPVAEYSHGGAHTEVKDEAESATTKGDPMATPIRTRKVSHVLLHVSDIERSVKFYTEILGFQESDRNHLGMVFLRNGTDHHTFGLVPGPKDATVAPKDKYLTFHHMALEVGGVDDLFKAREFLKQHGIEFVFEGRRGAGCNVSLEFHDPDGYMMKLTCEMEQIGWNQSARPHSLHRPAKSLEDAVANPV